jgi:serine protease Do
VRLKIPIGRARTARRLIAAALGLPALLLASASALPAYAAAPAGDQLRRAGIIAAPSAVTIHYHAEAYLNDNRDGKSYGPYQDDAWGSGFFISSDGYIATAAHLAALTNDQVKNDLVEVYLQDDAENAGCKAAGNCTAVMDKYRAGYQKATQLSELQTQTEVFTQDMNAASKDTHGLPAQLKASSPDGQADIAILKVNGDNEPILPLGSASSVQSQDPISVIGYPGVGDTSAQTLLVPTVTSGSITALKQGSADFGLAPGVSIYQTDAAIEHGDSGGPGINQDGQVVGLVSFGGGNATYFLISVKEIRDQAKQAGADNNLGQIDRLWRQGLTYFDQHRYVKAKAVFDQCVTLNKVQVGCAQYATKAAGLLSKDEESKYTSSLPTGLIAGIGGGILLLLILGAVLFVVLSRRGRPGPPQPQAEGWTGPTAYTPTPGPTGPVGPQAPPTPQAPPPTQVGFVPPQQQATPEQAQFCSNCSSVLISGQSACPRCGHQTA